MDKECSPIDTVTLSPPSAIVIDTDVVIIGNGPSGLALSAFLSGWQPYYNANRAHPKRQLHDRMNFDWLQDGIDEHGGSNSNGHELSLLYDTLARPDADLGHDHPSSLCWRRSANRRIAHVVIGDTAPGGSWNRYDDDMMALSVNGWLDLPAFSMVDWFGGKALCARLPALVVRKYFHSYPKQVDIRKNLLSNARVTHVQKLSKDADGKQYWQVGGMTSAGRPFNYRCRKVVFATGKNKPNKLNVPGEDANHDVVYDVESLKRRLQSIDGDQTEYCGNVSSSDNNNNGEPVVVVGDGISGADCILYCLANNIPVLHVFRRSDRQIKNTLLGRLSNSIYPEYAAVYRLMIGRDVHPHYRRSALTRVVSISNRQVDLLVGDRLECQPFRLLVACVGRSPSIDVESGGTGQSFEFNGSSYKSTSDSDVLAVGSLAGDHFVRYLVGGCLFVAKQLFAELFDGIR